MLFTNLSLGQFVFEHAYNQNIVKRIKLKYSGEKYYIYNSVTKNVELYNADHTFWKLINLQAPIFLGNQVAIWSVSDGDIIDDANIEVVFTYYHSQTDGFTTTSNIVSETGTTLFNLPGCTNLIHSEIEGLPKKMIAWMADGSSRVFQLESFAQQANFPEGKVFRIELENSGEKYYVLNQAEQAVKIYNSNFTLWKTISTPIAANATFDWVDFVSETLINPDAAIELTYTYHVNDAQGNLLYYVGNVVSETAVLLSEANIFGYTLSHLEGLPDKLIGLRFVLPSYSSTVFSLPSLTAEHTYAGYMNRIKLQNSGEKYFNSESAGSQNAVIYNGDHTIWKTIALPVSGNSTVRNVNNVSELTLNNDLQTELSFTTYNSATGYQTKFINESGVVLLDIPNASSVSFSQLPDLEDKLMTMLSFPGINGFGSSVYGLDISLASLGFEKQETVVYPNPASEIIHIKTNESVVSSVAIYNVQGALVQTETGTNIASVTVKNLKPGLYFMKLNDIKGKQSIHKILVSKQF